MTGSFSFRRLDKAIGVLVESRPFSADASRISSLKVDDLLVRVAGGSGVCGWDETALYMTDRSNEDFVCAVNVGIVGKASIPS